MSVSKRAVIGAASPLEHPGILLHVLNILGPGHHLFISAVSKAWRESYERIASVLMVGVACDDHGDQVLHTINPETTLCSAVFASTARLTLACAYDFSLEADNYDAECIQQIAGRVADVPTLRAARELGLQLTDEVLIGAAESGSTLKLQWLHTDHGCKLPSDICDYAAFSGSIDTLRWLKGHGAVFRAATCACAATRAHMHVLQYLRDEGCEWDANACHGAAERGHLLTLQWLHERGCPWDAESICGSAAESGSTEMLRYLKQQGCECNEDTMAGAAMEGRLLLCQLLAAEGCPWDHYVTVWAACRGHVSTLRWLHDSGCPWVTADILREAAERGRVEVLAYMQVSLVRHHSTSSA
jgi:hypothetical protein